jgi:hypothetical protein
MSTLASMEPPIDTDEPRQPPSSAGTDALRALIGSAGGPGALSDGLAGQTRALIELVEANRAKLDGLVEGTPTLSLRIELRLPPPAPPDDPVTPE